MKTASTISVFSSVLSRHFWFAKKFGTHLSGLETFTFNVGGWSRSEQKTDPLTTAPWLYTRKEQLASTAVFQWIWAFLYARFWNLEVRTLGWIFSHGPLLMIPKVKIHIKLRYFLLSKMHTYILGTIFHPMAWFSNILYSLWGLL